MERRRFGPTPRDIPVMGQGTWYSDGDDRNAEGGDLHLTEAELRRIDEVSP